MARKKRTKKGMKNSRKNREKIARIIVETMKVFKEDDKRLRVTEFDSTSGLEKKRLMSDSWVATPYKVDAILAQDSERNPADSLDDFVKTLFSLSSNRGISAALKAMV